jgi:hypothetical protein
VGAAVVVVGAAVVVVGAAVVVVGAAVVVVGGALAGVDAGPGVEPTVNDADTDTRVLNENCTEMVTTCVPGLNALVSSMFARPSGAPPIKSYGATRSRRSAGPCRSGSSSQKSTYFARLVDAKIATRPLNAAP